MWRRFISPDDSAYLDPESINGLNLYCYCGNDPVNYIDPSGQFSILSLFVSIGVSLFFEVVDDARDGRLFDGSHDWKDYLGAVIAGTFGVLGGKKTELVWSVIGSFADAVLSGNLEEDGFCNTMFDIAASSILSGFIGKKVNDYVIKGRVSALKSLSNNNLANRKLKAMGVNIKIGSNAAKANGGLYEAIKDHDKWIGNVLSKDLVGAVSGGLISLGWSCF